VNAILRGCLSAGNCKRTPAVRGRHPTRTEDVVRESAADIYTRSGVPKNAILYVFVLDPQRRLVREFGRVPEEQERLGDAVSIMSYASSAGPQAQP